MLTEDGNDRERREQQRQRDEAAGWFLFREYKQRLDAENRRQAELFRAKRAYDFGRAYPYGFPRLVRRIDQLPASERFVTRQAAAELRAWFDLATP